MSLRDQWTELEPATRLRAGGAVVVLLLLAICYSALHDQTGKLARKRSSREAALAEMMLLRQRYRDASAGAQKLANRLSAVSADDSVAKLFEEIGIKGKNSQIKALKGEERPGFLEDAAEIKVEGLSANEAVNLLYRLEKGSKPVAIKRANLKTRYDDPAKLDITLNVVLLKPALQERK